MSKFLRTLFIVCLPALVLLGWLEYRLSAMDTHYYTKRISFEKQLDRIEILSLGSSNAYFSIDPASFSHVGYNLAINSQSPYYDYELVAKYIDRMPKLHVVILPAIFLQMGIDLPKTVGFWRMYFYRQYWGIPLESDPDGDKPYDYILEPKNFSKIALFGDNIYDYFSHRFQDKVDYDPESNGWIKADASWVKPADLKDKNGEISAAAHNNTVDVSLFANNLVYWQRLADLLHQRNIKLVVVRLPADVTYWSHLDPDKISKFKTALSQFAERNHAVYADYTEDKRFGLDDFTFMVDHMNPQGAAKFSAILDREVLQPLF